MDALHLYSRQHLHPVCVSDLLAVRKHIHMTPRDTPRAAEPVKRRNPGCGYLDSSRMSCASLKYAVHLSRFWYFLPLLCCCLAWRWQASVAFSGLCRALSHCTPAVQMSISPHMPQWLRLFSALTCPLRIYGVHQAGLPMSLMSLTAVVATALQPCVCQF